MSNQEEFGFGDVWINGESPFLAKEGDKYVIRHTDGVSLIANDCSVCCNRIEILNGVGILCYFQDRVTRFFEENVILLECRNGSICIKNKIESYSIIYLYMNKRENSVPTFMNIKYEVGDIVYPSNLPLYRNYKNAHKGSSAAMHVINSLYKSDLESEIFSDDVLMSFKVFAFKVVEKVGDFYVIQLNIEDDDIKYLCNQRFFSYDEQLKSKDEVIAEAKNLKDILNQ